jgi:phi13 family phage major tail protein
MTKEEMMQAEGLIEIDLQLFANKIRYGLKNVYIAFATGAATWAAPQKIPGAVRFTPTPKGEESEFYADDGPYFVITCNNGYDAEIEWALIPDAILAEMLGWDTDDNGMIVEVADGTPKKFALMGEVKGDSKNRRFVYWDCQAARPSDEKQTKGETIEPKTEVLPLKILPIEIGGKPCVKGTLELSDTNAAVFNSWFDAVVVPDATPAAVSKTELAAAIALAGTLVEAEYTAGTWTAMQAALTTATTVNANASATQVQVNEATADLQAAILDLVAV